MNTVLTQLIDTLSALDNICDAASVGPVIHAHLPAVLRHPHLLAGVDIPPDADKGYTKVTLHAHTGKNPWSVQALIWQGGAKTPIHNHKCFCTFAMYRGEIDEHRYDTNGTYQSTMCYTAGDIASMTPDGNDIHRMVNTSDNIAISLHFYGINAHKDNSIRHIFKDPPISQVA